MKFEFMQKMTEYHSIRIYIHHYRNLTDNWLMMQYCNTLSLKDRRIYYYFY